MRSVLSSAVLFSIVFSSVGPGFGQRLVRQSPATKVETTAEKGRGNSDADRATRPPVLRPEPKRSPKQTEFGKLDSFTEGTGAWVRWSMEVERKNSGFYVYRMEKNRAVLVSGLILGSSFKVGDQVLTEAEYNAYDPKGTKNSKYFVEAVGDDGKTLRSKHVTPVLTATVASIPGGAKIKEETFAPRPGENIVSESLQVSSELQTEIQSGLFTQDPVRHRDVISRPGGVRIASKADGLIRVTKAELQGAGFDVDSDATNWQLYMDGAELYMIVGPNSDYIEFFGQGLDTLATDIRTYYLIRGDTPGRRIPTQTVLRPLTSVVSRKYDQARLFEPKKNYTTRVLNGDVENWWGDGIGSAYVDFKFDLSGIDRTPGTRKLTITLQGMSFTQHSIELILNGGTLPNVTGSGRRVYEATIDVPVSFLIDGENTLRMRAVGLGFGADLKPINGDSNFFDKVSLEFPRAYLAMDNKLEFFTENYKNTDLTGFTSSNIRVFDVTHESTPRLLTDLDMVQTNGTWGTTLPAGRGQVLYAIEAGAYGTALSVTPNDPALLRDPSNAGTWIAIAHPSLMAEANAWAAYRSSQGVVTKVVDVTEIYDEFNYGVMSSQAIEDFLFYAKNNWQVPPSYVLLIGDGHYDSRNYDSFDPGYWNMIPSRLVDTLYEQTGSDEALSDFDDDDLADIPIGRIPARTGEFVTAALNKTIAWESSLTPNSLNRGVLFAYDWPDRWDFHAMSDRIMAQLPESVPKTSISQESPTGSADIVNAVNELDGGTPAAPGPNAGQYLLNYSGHGNVVAWRNNSFFSATQAPLLTNATFPSLITALTCLNGYFMTDFESFSEVMLKSSNGGAVAVWASTGETTPDIQELMAERFYFKVGEGQISHLGDLINDAKSVVPAGADVRSSWALLGDPMLKVR